jgi:uncharacterized damage-inducible protein DinB
MDRAIIDHYESGAQKLAQSIRGLTREDLLAFPVPGTWSIQQIVIHLADCEQVYADRMKRIIAEDHPTLQGFDQNKWVAALGYEKQSADDAVKLVELTRRQMATVLRQLPDKAFERTGVHSEYGKRTLRDLVEGATKHLEHHLKFVHQKRAAMGKEMW